MSVILKAILTLFIAYDFYQTFSRVRPVVSVKYALNDFVIDSKAVGEIISPIELGFDIGISLVSKP